MGVCDMVYDVTYPNSKDLDSDVGDTYLDNLRKKARADRTLLGAMAKEKNGDGTVLVLVDGVDGPEWK